MLYICTKFHENISKGFRATELTHFLISKFSKRHRSVENIGGVMILALNTFSDHALYFGLDFQYSKFSKGHSSVKM